jgi:cell fate regulator YaaT (PSP1 superfamily)
MNEENEYIEIENNEPDVLTEIVEAPLAVDEPTDAESQEDDTDYTGASVFADVDLPEVSEDEDDILLEPEKCSEEFEVNKELFIDHRILAGKLTTFNWLADIPDDHNDSDIVEVRFKNTRKGYFINSYGLTLKQGDIVAVESSLGHDVGVVSLTGKLVEEQMRLKRTDIRKNPLRKIYRKAKQNDIEKWQQAIAMEYDTMIEARRIAADLRLNMKIGDVEYQGDKTKAIFYYISDERVDFRELIKVLADTFHIRVEMKQIGSRQEAGRIGGIGPCGRKLCCSAFISNFVSVSTSAARYQDLSLNPQKLAGQCGKLKCCLNFEIDAYIDEQKDFPSTNIPLNTGDGMLYHQKTDIFGRTMTYSFDRSGRGLMLKLPVARVKEIIKMNRKGIIPPKADDEVKNTEQPIGYTDGVGEESLSRFDDKRSKKRSKNRNRNNRNNRPNNGDNNNTNDNDANAPRKERVLIKAKRNEQLPSE